MPVLDGMFLFLWPYYSYDSLSGPSRTDASTPRNRSIKPRGRRKTYG